MSYLLCNKIYVRQYKRDEENNPWSLESHGIHILTGTKIWRKMIQWLAEYANTQSAPDR